MNFINIQELGIQQKDIDRFWRKVAFKQFGCWEWLARKEKKGYAQFWLKERTVLGHRVAYTITRGAITEGLTLDHLCGNTSCVNPNHLEMVTLRENLLRGDNFIAINFRKTHCLRGHQLPIERNDNRGRFCLACRKEMLTRIQEHKYQKRGYGKKEQPPKNNCKYGHAFSGDNLYINKKGHRYCRQCAREKLKTWREGNPERNKELNRLSYWRTKSSE